MADIITRNSTPTVVIPNLVSVVHDYTGARRIETILHPQMNGSGHTVTYKPPRLRSGRLSLLFDSDAHAAAAVAILATSYNFTLAADVASTSMTFVLAPGELDPQPQEDNDSWLVVVPYQEVTT